MRNAPSRSYLLAEFTYPILPPHNGGAMWFYSLPQHDSLCLSAEKLYKDYLGAVKYGNVFSLDVGPDYEGRIRKIDVETLQKVGRMIRTPPRFSVAMPGWFLNFGWDPNANVFYASRMGKPAYRYQR
jgi:hypothetical protein